MRHFSYFLFENFDADAHSHDPLNPRRFPNAETTTFTIRYSKKGLHIVPDYPSRKGDKAKQ